jgi:hypothetical protein
MKIVTLTRSISWDELERHKLMSLALALVAGAGLPSAPLAQQYPGAGGQQSPYQQYPNQQGQYLQSPNQEPSQQAGEMIFDWLSAPGRWAFKCDDRYGNIYRRNGSKANTGIQRATSMVMPIIALAKII